MTDATARDLVVIVGAGPGLGASIGTAFARTGARVVLLARERERLARLAADVASATGGAVDAIPGDAADETALRSAFAEIRGRHGDPTVLVHNPSVAVVAPPTQTPYDGLLAGLQLTVGSLLVAAQEVVQPMRQTGRGTILVTGSGSALTGSTWSAALAVQKAAVRNLALSFAAELHGDGIHVAIVTINGVLDKPGFERDRIAAEYVRLHKATDSQPDTWHPELTWTGRMARHGHEGTAGSPAGA
ncbi:MAG: SDR family NAD(P)-dependent oxidoreductase [Jiangellaceae bacterium]